VLTFHRSRTTSEHISASKYHASMTSTFSDDLPTYSTTSTTRWWNFDTIFTPIPNSHSKNTARPRWCVTVSSSWAGTQVVSDRDGCRSSPSRSQSRTSSNDPCGHRRATRHGGNQISFASVNDGVMHACGHDVHTAVSSVSRTCCHAVKNSSPVSSRCCSSRPKRRWAARCNDRRRCPDR